MGPVRCVRQEILEKDYELCAVPITTYRKAKKTNPAGVLQVESDEAQRENVWMLRDVYKQSPQRECVYQEHRTICSDATLSQNKHATQDGSPARA